MTKRTLCTPAEHLRRRSFLKGSLLLTGTGMTVANFGESLWLEAPSPPRPKSKRNAVSCSG